ncbi:hypothetical protein [Bacillus sp. KH172YL63]|uniref:hypothetical protein n=1 Tax=Bacillus sp. KH172YL63 TaxID=2709784 RepID=UPI0013E454B8|nr:hypothetical protein [Bacillus sp. KH172YL63]BCB02531.1 hypothetical protein KH172YL63_06640 [Bacillus sp. KH172YL63]
MKKGMVFVLSGLACLLVSLLVVLPTPIFATVLGVSILFNVYGTVLLIGFIRGTEKMNPE